MTLNRMKWYQGLLWAALLLLVACSSPARNQPTQPGPGTPTSASTPVTTTPTVSRLADVLSVQVSGDSGAYTFAVEIASPDENCFQYADWWEILDGEGNLLYRRVLTHSHVDEQPFTRSGGPVPIEADTLIWIRAHMNIDGYGGAAFKGSVQDGFETMALDAGFAANLANQAPLPQDCAF